MPENLQEPIFMGIQYSYALLTMLPCPIWFWYRWASAGFLMGIFTWACWNGATFYIDVFGKRMEKELEALRREVARMAKSPELNGQSGVGSPFASPEMTGTPGNGGGVGRATGLDLGPAARQDGAETTTRRERKGSDDEELWAQYAAQGRKDKEAETPGLEIKKSLSDGAPPGEDTNGTMNVNGSVT